MAWVPSAFGAFSGLGRHCLPSTTACESFLLLPGPQGRSPDWPAASWPCRCPPREPRAVEQPGGGVMCQGVSSGCSDASREVLSPVLFLPPDPFEARSQNSPWFGILSGPRPPDVPGPVPRLQQLSYGKRLRHTEAPAWPRGFRLRSSCWSSPGEPPGLAGALGTPPASMETGVLRPGPLFSSLAPSAAITGSERRSAALELRKWGGSRPFSPPGIRPSRQ